MKKIDVMTVISIILILIMLVALFLSDSCSSEVDFVNRTSLLNFGQLFGGIVYAYPQQMPQIPQIPRTAQLNGVLRSNTWYYKNICLLMVFNFNCISDNKIF